MTTSLSLDLGHAAFHLGLSTIRLCRKTNVHATTPSPRMPQ